METEGESTADGSAEHGAGKDAVATEGESTTEGSAEHEAGEDTTAMEGESTTEGSAQHAPGEDTMAPEEESEIVDITTEHTIDEDSAEANVEGVQLTTPFVHKCTNLTDTPKVEPKREPGKTLTTPFVHKCTNL